MMVNDLIKKSNSFLRYGYGKDDQMGLFSMTTTYHEGTQG